MKKLLSFVIVTLMIVSAVIPAFALSEAPAKPEPAENHINIWLQDAELNLTESNTVDVYLTISDNTDGFEYLKCILVYPNCLTIEDIVPMGFAEDDMQEVSEKTAIEKSFFDALTDTGYDPYEVLGIDENNQEAGGKYKWVSPYFDCERKEKVGGKTVDVDCFDEGTILKITFSYDDTLNTEFGDTITIKMYDSPDDQLHCYRKGYKWSDEPFIAVIHDGVININRTASPHTHTPGEPVIENEVPATSEAPGSYDSVVYCTKCGEEISRETVIVYYNPTVKVSSEEINQGDAEAEFTVEIINNPGFYGTYLYFIYDKDLAFASNGFTEGAVGVVTLNPNEYPGVCDVDVSTYKRLGEFKSDLEAAGIDYTDKQMVIVGIENSVVKNITDDGVLFKVKLNTAGLAAGEYDINIVNSSLNTRDVDDQPVLFDLVQGKLTVAGCTHDFSAETVDAKYLKSAADCTHPAVYYKSCIYCGVASDTETFEYGEANGHTFTAETVDAKYLKTPADCTNAAVYYKSCTVCGEASTNENDVFTSGEALGHDFTREAVEDQYLKSAADCTNAAVYYKSCSRCYIASTNENDTFTYGEANGHTFTAETVDAKYLKTPADCENAAVYYKSCAVCGEASTNENDVFTYGTSLGHDYKSVVTAPTCEVGGYTTYTCTRCKDSYIADQTDPLGHSFTREAVEDQYLKSAADCTNAAVYYKSCSRCYIASTSDKDTFTYGEALGHDFTREAVEDQYLKTPADCTNAAVYYKSCSRCYIASTNENDTFTYGEANGHDWEETGRTGTCGEIGTINYKCKNCQETKTENDTLIEHSFTLEVIDEAHLKTPADCENAAVYYKGCSRCGAISTSEDDTFTYGEALGHSFTREAVEDQYLKSAADCTNAAVYYKSCSRCFAASTDENDVFTYGEANGHTFTAETVDAKYLKTPADCTNAAVYYKSCTVCGEASTNENDVFTSGTSLGHDFSRQVAEDQYLKTPADCTNAAVYYKSCSRCYIASTNENDVFTSGEALGHDFTRETVEDQYLKSPADCENPAVYYKNCSRCYIASTNENDVFTYGKSLGHDYKSVVTAPTCEVGGYTTYTCPRCNDSYIAEQTDPLGHSFTREVVEDQYLKSAADCTNAAVYYKSCSRCYIASTSDKDTFTSGEALGHSFTREAAEDQYLKTPADCTNAAVYYKSCSRCYIASTNENDVFTSGEALGHDFTRETVEDQYLKSPADCENPAVYYKNCSRCYTASTTETFTVGEALGHDFTRETVEDQYLKSVADCENPAVYYKNCSRCYTASTTETFTVGDALGHDYQNGTDVEIILDPENIQNKLTLRVCSRGDCAIDQNTNTEYDVEVIQPTCTKEGCTRYINRTTEEVIVDPNSVTDMIPHNFLPGVPVTPTCTEKGYTPYTCTVGGEIEKRDFVDALGHAWSEGVVTKEATATEEGVKTFTCTRCGATKTETIPKTDGSKQTGDNIATIVFVAMIALASGAAVVVVKKKVFGR